MGRKLDWLGGHLGATDNPLGSLLGWGVDTAMPWTWGKGSSLLRRGRDRMSQQGSGVGSWGEDDSPSPQKISGGDVNFGNNEEVLIRLTSIENILRDMSQLATESGQRDIEEVEEDRQAQEALHRLAEQEPDGPDISLSPIRVEEEKKSGGLFSSLFSGLGKLLSFLGPTGSVIVGLGLLAGGLALVNKFFGGGEGGEGEGGGGLPVNLTPTQWGRVAVGTTPRAVGALGTGIGRGGAWAAERAATNLASRATATNTPVRLTRAAEEAASNLTAARQAQSTLGSAPRQPMPMGPTRPVPAERMAKWLSDVEKWEDRKKILDAAVATAKTASDDAAAAALRAATTRAARLTSASSRLSTAAPWIGKFGKGMGFLAPLIDTWQYQHMEEGWQKDLKLAAIALGTYGAVASVTPAAPFGWGAMGLGTLMSLTADIPFDKLPGYWQRAMEIGSNTIDSIPGHAVLSASDLEGPEGDSPIRPYIPQPFRAPQSKLGYIQSELEHAGYSHDQAQAVMKNMSDESGFDEDAEGDYQTIGGERRPTAFGIAQWRGDRATNMEAHVAGSGRSRFEGQVGFLIKELADYNLSPQQMPDDYPSAYNAVMDDYEKPAEQHARERRIPMGTPAPDRERAPTWTATRDFSGVGAASWRTPAPVETIARGRTTTPTADSEGDGALAPTAVVAPQTTNNFFDNRSTNIIPPPLDARNRDAVLMATQNLQGLTHAIA